MTNLGIVVENYSVGGSDRIAQQLCDSIHADKKFIFVNRGNDLSILNRSLNASIIKYRFITIPELGSLSKKINKYLMPPIKFLNIFLRYPLIIIHFFIFIYYINKYDIDILISNNGSYPGGECNRAASLAGIFCGVKKNVMIFHNYPVRSKIIFRIIENVYDSILDKNVVIVSVATSIANELLKIRNFKNVPSIVYSGVHSEIDVCPKKNINCINILNVGELSDRKNQLFFIDVVNRIILNNKNLTINATIVGSEGQDIGYRELLVNRINELNLNSVIKIEEFNNNINYYYENASLYIHTAKVESLPLTILEAMSFGLPVISCDSGDIGFAVRDGINGFVVKNNDINKFLEHINYIFKSEYIYNELANNSKNLQKEYFSLETMTRNYNQLILSYGL